MNNQCKNLIIGYIAIGAQAAMNDRKTLKNFDSVLRHFSGQLGLVDQVLQSAHLVTEIYDLLDESFELIFAYDVAERFGYDHASNLIANITDKIELIAPFNFLHDITGLNYSRVQYSVYDEITGDHEIFETQEQAEHYKEKIINDYCSGFIDPATATQARQKCNSFYQVHKITSVFIDGNLNHVDRELVIDKSGVSASSVFIKQS